MSATKHRLIAFTGPKEAGKSTAAEAFPDAARISFAEPIRRMLLALGVPEQNLRVSHLKEVGLPQFGGANVSSDARAVEIMRALCPERRIVPIDSRDILLGGGNIHCVTQQIPKGAKQ